MSNYKYPKDDFDKRASLGPSGTHFQPVSRWRAGIPLLVVLILAPLAGWGLMLFVSPADTPAVTQMKSSAAKQPTTTVQPTTPAPTAPTAKAEKTPAAAPKSSEAASGPVSKSRSVRVLNNSGIGGLAKKVSRQLQAGGYSKLYPDNARNIARSDSNRVYYGADRDKNTALDVAKNLGIPSSAVAKDEKIAGDAIAVILNKRP